jgi:hypothetical protein
MAQQSTSTSPSIEPETLPALQGPTNTGCNPWRHQPLTATPSLSQRVCFELADLLRPSVGLRGGALAGLGSWHGMLHPSDANHDGFALRFAVYYSRRTAKATGELLAGYLNHEDPRPQMSSERGGWNRTRSALLSVVRIKDANGHARPALAPLAGAFSSGMVGMALSPNRNSLNSGFERAEVVYGTYFISAVAREFKPDLLAVADRILHRRR